MDAAKKPAMLRQMILLRAFEEKLEELSKEQLSPPPLISGKDLIALGFAPGPKFKEILSALETEQLEGRLINKEEAIDFVRTNFKI